VTDRAAVRAWLVAIGAISMLGQVALLRELEVAFFGSELIYVLALGVWLAWTALGAAVGGRGWRPSATAVRLLLLGLAAALPASVVFSRGLRGLFGAVPGAYLPFAQQLAGLTLALLPVGVALGLLFQCAARRYVGDGRTLAGAYVAESVGAVAGGLSATLLLQCGVQNWTAALLAAALALAAACLPCGERRPRGFRSVAATLGALLIFAFGLGGPLDRGMTRWNHPALVATQDTPYGRVTVDAMRGLVSVFNNDALAFDNQGTAAEEFVHVAALSVASPRRALVLGGGVAGLLRELLRHRPLTVDYVELDRAFLDAVAPSLDPRDREALEDPAVTVHIADPRRFLDSANSYDLILVGMPEPDSGQANRYYTREFFYRCRDRLDDRGLLALRLRASENLWTPLQAHRLGSVHRALREAFQETLAVPVGSGILLLGSPSSFPRAPDLLVQRLEARGLDSPLVIPAYLDYLFTNDRFTEAAARLARTVAPINSDLRPVCYPYTLLIWLSAFYPALAQAELPQASLASLAYSPALILGLLVLGVALIVARRRPMVRRAALAATAGLVGMIVEASVLLHYQTNHGVLFRDIGLLLTSFMVGLALGAEIVDRRARRRRAGEGSSRTDGWLALAAFVVAALAAAALLGSGAAPGLLGTGLLLVLAGALVAAIFAHASLRGVPEQRGVISPLYAADLAGGCAGSLLASLVLVPLLGLPAAVVCAAALALAAMLLV
jgi:spermidine synthase